MVLLLTLLTALSQAQPLEESLEAIVLLTQGDATCAGTIVDGDGTIVTSYHCVAQGGSVWVQTRHGVVAKGRVIARAKGNDLAVLAAPDLSGMASLSIRTDDPSVGAEVWTLGHPFGAQVPSRFLRGTLRWAAAEGMVSAVGERALQISAPVNPGNSGGAVVDNEGRLVGVVSRHLRGDGMGFATRSALVSRLLAKKDGAGWFGGVVKAGLTSDYTAYTDGVPTLGLELVGAVRDRILMSAQVAIPLGAKWNTFSYDGASWTDLDIGVGGRLRFGSGLATTRFDVVAGVSSLSEMLLHESGAFLTHKTWAPSSTLTWRSGGTGVGYSLIALPEGVVTRVRIHFAIGGPLVVF
jgi:hypothetical protein